MWYKNVDTSFFPFVTIHVFVRRTDGQSQTQICQLHPLQLHLHQSIRHARQSPGYVTLKNINLKQFNSLCDCLCLFVIFGC